MLTIKHLWPGGVDLSCPCCGTAQYRARSQLNYDFAVVDAVSMVVAESTRGECRTGTLRDLKQIDGSKHLEGMTTNVKAGLIRLELK